MIDFELSALCFRRHCLTLLRYCNIFITFHAPGMAGQNTALLQIFLPIIVSTGQFCLSFKMLDIWDKMSRHAGLGQAPHVNCYFIIAITTLGRCGFCLAFCCDRLREPAFSRRSTLRWTISNAVSDPAFKAMPRASYWLQILSSVRQRTKRFRLRLLLWRLLFCRLT
jgi:hypothetical protein